MSSPLNDAVLSYLQTNDRAAAANDERLDLAAAIKQRPANAPLVRALVEQLAHRLRR